MSAPPVATAINRRMNRPVARASIASLVALVALLVASASSAATTPTRAAQNRTAYCKLLVSFNKKENTARQVYSSITSPVPTMKAAYKALNGVAVQILHVAPPPLKGTYTKEVNALHEVYSGLAKVNFDYLSLPESEIMSFEAIQTSVTAETKKISTFDKKFCSAKG